MNLGTHGMAVQGYIALHNGTYQNLELLMDVSRVLVNIFIFIFTITLLMILLLIDFLHDDNHHLNATITPNDNNSTRDVSDAIINTIVN